MCVEKKKILINAHFGLKRPKYRFLKTPPTLNRGRRHLLEIIGVRRAHRESTHDTIRKRVTAEWVEIPQFSDDEKVYRVPGFNKFEINKKLYVINTETPAIHGFPNVTTIIHGINKLHINKPPEMSQSWINKPLDTSSIGMESNKIHVSKPSGLSQTWFVKPTVSSLNGMDSPQITVTEETIYLPGNSPLSTLPTPQNVENFPDDNHYVTVEEENVEEEATVSTTDNIEQISNNNQTTTSEKPASQESVESDEDNDSNRSFLYFIPVELFRKVHRTLKSQPATLKGKMHFLKNFEKALLAEIQKRLLPVVTPVRKRRESRGDHGWDDHDDGVGFPSLEGALMAISFLTFAVYLVQLVMMLFRNLGTQPTPGTGTATVLFNRNKRSLDDLNERTARIHEYLDKYANTQFIDD